VKERDPEKALTLHLASPDDDVGQYVEDGRASPAS
jgi:hypothetical protein